MRRRETKEEIERKTQWATEGKIVTPKPEDISVILGRIREKAEAIATRRERVSDEKSIVMLDMVDAQRISALVEQALKATLEQQLTASLGGTR